MKISRVELRPYALPLTRPLPGGGGARTREGVLVGFHDSDGHVGWGDCAPLPGFSGESLAEAGDALGSAAAMLPGLEVDASPADWRPVIESVGTQAKWPPSAQFAVETALVDLLAVRTGQHWESRLGHDSSATLEVNALWPPGEHDIEARAAAVVATGAACLKIKVGHLDAHAAARRVARLHEALGATVALRLDANRQWAMATAEAFAGALGDVPVEYIEEPVSNPRDLARFHSRSGMPIALDETLAEGDAALACVEGPVAAFVIKPTLIGGIAAACRWAGVAAARGAVPVISGCFESGVGIRALARLAACLTPPGVAVGLDMPAWIAGDTVSPPLALGPGRVSLNGLCDGTVVVAKGGDA